MLFTERKPRWIKNYDNMHMTVMEDNMGECVYDFGVGKGK